MILVKQIFNLSIPCSNNYRLPSQPLIDSRLLKFLAYLVPATNDDTFQMINISHTGIDLSKILGVQTKLLGGQKVIKCDKCMGVYQLLGERVRAAPPSLPQVYAYDITYWLTIDQLLKTNPDRVIDRV